MHQGLVNGKSEDSTLFLLIRQYNMGPNNNRVRNAAGYYKFPDRIHH